MSELKGVHHVTAITSSAEKIYEFFIYIRGFRLVKKTVNQDDIKTYHLLFADDEGNPGTDVTFFDFQNIPKADKGSEEISRIGLRVPSTKALNAGSDSSITTKSTVETSKHSSEEKHLILPISMVRNTPFSPIKA